MAGTMICGPTSAVAAYEFYSPGCKLRGAIQHVVVWRVAAESDRRGMLYGDDGIGDAGFLPCRDQPELPLEGFGVAEPAPIKGPGALRRVGCSSRKRRHRRRR